MSSITHIVKTGDRLINISRMYFGIPSRWPDIVKTNSYLKERENDGRIAVDGSPLIFDGDILVIVTDGDVIADVPVDSKKTSPITDASDSQSIVLTLNGTETQIKQGASFVHHFDSCCDQFSSEFPFDASNYFDRDTWRPLRESEINLFIGGKQLFGGKVEQAIPVPGRAIVEVSARSHTKTLLKSVIPAQAYPLERENETLFQIAQWACGIFGFTVENIDDAPGKFKKVAFENSGIVYTKLQELAQKKKRIISCSNDGKIIHIKKPVVGASAGRFEEGKDGFDPPVFPCNTAELHGNFLSVPEINNRPCKLVSYRNPSYDDGSVGYIDISDVPAGETQSAIEYQALKEYRDFFTSTFTPNNGVFNKNGNPWEPGQVVTINAPSSMIYKDFDFLIQKIEWDLFNRKPVLTVIPPQAYLGEKITEFPWD